MKIDLSRLAEEMIKNSENSGAKNNLSDEEKKVMIELLLGGLKEKGELEVFLGYHIMQSLKLSDFDD